MKPADFQEFLGRDGLGRTAEFWGAWPHEGLLSGGFIIGGGPGFIIVPAGPGLLSRGVYYREVAVTFILLRIGVP